MRPRRVAHRAPRRKLLRRHPGTGKTHLSIALGIPAARRGHRVAFATAHEWVVCLGEAQRAGRIDDELGHPGRSPLVICDEIGYIRFDPEAAALFFALVSSRYERSSLIVSSNKIFSEWTEIFGYPQHRRLLPAGAPTPALPMARWEGTPRPPRSSGFHNFWSYLRPRTVSYTRGRGSRLLIVSL